MGHPYYESAKGIVTLTLHSRCHGIIAKKPCLAMPPRPPEAADTEIQENDDNHRRCHKRPMVGSLLPARPSSPQNRTEDQNGEEEEDAGNLQPDFAADAAEGLEESAESASHTAGGLPCGAATVGGFSGWRTRLGIRRNRIGLLAFAHDGLAGRTTRHAQSDAQHPADGFRSHFVTTPATTQRVPACCRGPG